MHNIKPRLTIKRKICYNKFVEMDKHESMKQFLNKSENVDNQ